MAAMNLSTAPPSHSQTVPPPMTAPLLTNNLPPNFPQQPQAMMAANTQLNAQPGPPLLNPQPQQIPPQLNAHQQVPPQFNTQQQVPPQFNTQQQVPPLLNAQQPVRPLFNVQVPPIQSVHPAPHLPTVMSTSVAAYQPATLVATEAPPPAASVPLTNGHTDTASPPSTLQAVGAVQQQVPQDPNVVVAKPVPLMTDITLDASPSLPQVESDQSVQLT